MVDDLVILLDIGTPHQVNHVDHGRQSNLVKDLVFVKML